MNIFSFLAIVLAVQSAPQPDVHTLVPEIIDVAVEKSPWSAEGGYPEDRPIAIDFASFVREFANTTSESETKVSDAVDAVKNYRVVRGHTNNPRPWCASAECEEIGEGHPVMFVMISDLAQTSEGYRMRIALAYPSKHADRWSSSMVSFGVAFEHDGDKWTHRFVGEERRT